ncbi:hypothetical protein [Bacillus cereus]|uniref:hypothetical protein n=1 Tax=Bacillus cereus TaxID=1396 RepID=UPI0009AEB522|nr:hypothetical protein [Bacillus cereus]MCU4804522.1 hypothetical protein [Bacillus cereus]MCU5143256.1 hypothetical protein [Bacillus cereus]
MKSSDYLLGSEEVKNANGGYRVLYKKEVGYLKEYLLKAYMLEGYKIFFEENDKYFDLIKDSI